MIPLEELQKVQLFKGLRPEEAREFCKNFRVEKHTPQTVIFQEGTQSQDLYILAQGRVSIDLNVSGRHHNLCIMRRHDAFGEMALLDGRARSASATAIDSVECWVLNRNDFQALLLNQPRIGVVILHNLAVMLADRLRDSNILLRNHLTQSLHLWGTI